MGPAVGTEYDERVATGIDHDLVVFGMLKVVQRLPCRTILLTMSLLSVRSLATPTAALSFEPVGQTGENTLDPMLDRLKLTLLGPPGEETVDLCHGPVGPSCGFEPGNLAGEIVEILERLIIGTDSDEVQAESSPAPR